MRDALPLALFAAVLVFMVIIACGIVALLIQPAAPPGDGGEGAAGQPANETAAQNETQGIEDNVSAEDLESWDMITRDNVEAACLAKAKEEAGSKAGLVYSCDCDETISEGKKSYSCDISTADPFTDYFADIECVLEDRLCSISTNYVSGSVSFEELRALYGG